MAQFIESPVEPVQPDTQWLVWKRDIPLNTTMTTFGAKAAYLVKVADAAPDFTLQLTGRPQPPGYAWSSEGLNFFGFPMETPDDVDDRNFERFLSFSSELGAGPDIFSYEGGASLVKPRPGHCAALQGSFPRPRLLDPELAVHRLLRPAARHHQELRPQFRRHRDCPDDGDSERHG